MIATSVECTVLLCIIIYICVLGTDTLWTIFMLRIGCEENESFSLTWLLDLTLLKCLSVYLRENFI